jgi:murein L,D-transpeptidase YcbB/YkuD
MQDRYAIYLHDTPAKALFASDARHRSHGCVRVERAVEFARMLAQERGKAAAFDSALASGETTTVALGESIPVRLLYHTAYLGPNGQLVVTADPYGRDDDLAEALGLTRGSRRGAAPTAHLLGP